MNVGCIGRSSASCHDHHVMGPTATRMTANSWLFESGDRPAVDHVQPSSIISIAPSCQVDEAFKRVTRGRRRWPEALDPSWRGGHREVRCLQPLEEASHPKRPIGTQHHLHDKQYTKMSARATKFTFHHRLHQFHSVVFRPP